MDPVGWTAEKMEWLVTYYLFADDDVSLHFLMIFFFSISVLITCDVHCLLTSLLTMM